MRSLRSVHGAAAVEFALVVPLLLIVLFAILDLGWVFNQQLTVTAAAREGARHYAVHANEAGAQGEAEAIVAGIVPGTPTITYLSTCSPNVDDDELTMVVHIPLTDLTGWLDSITGQATLGGQGSMRCGG
ncbi:TadE/TadG family type IV pilus assembly protein [Agromyces subbeticus]|uniref:TadE/TadG family type IV pilus assembly protein n=1 Tax=Agromyces subbeticus TaxID=293890 RepID=UPI0003B3A261|nr:TadE family protein [Agromyces subbeticus]